jgi:glycerol-3-phosphate dehydrogenase subunit B
VIRDDVLVVGGGLAGLTAALSAARTGASVRVISHKKSTLRQASGLIDVLGYRDGDLVADPFAAVDALSEGHPYERVGVEAIRDGLALFDSVTGYCGGHTDRNALVPTHGGTVKPTARYPGSVAAGLASDDRPTLLVGFEGLTDFDAPLAADHLRAAGVPFDVAGATVSFPVSLRADATVTRYARLLDEDAPVDGDGGGERGRRVGGADRVRAALASAVEPPLDASVTRVGFPAVLGEDSPGEVRAALERALGAAVFEVPMGPPSLPGMRLETALVAACDDAGVGMDTGTPVVGYEAAGGRVTAVEVERTHSRVPYGADQFVLATGGLVGKGIDSGRGGVREPVFDCHVPAPGDRYDWAAEDAFGDHAFARFGVVPDRDLRPLDADGVPEFGNLRAAGGVLGGADTAREKSAGGVAVATGYAAGRAAGREVSP